MNVSSKAGRDRDNYVMTTGSLAQSGLSSDDAGIGGISGLPPAQRSWYDALRRKTHDAKPRHAGMQTRRATMLPTSRRTDDSLVSRLRPRSNNQDLIRMEVILPPRVQLGRRYCLLAVLLLPVVFVPHMSLWLRLVACILPVALTGTYRISVLDGDRFKTQLFFMFVPIKTEKCNLPGVIYVETKYNATGLGTFLMFVFGFIFDLLIPALGGAYEIWLVTAKGREMVAWQGFNQSLFEENLQLLSSRTGAEVRGRST
jgi:hypothetical protein